MAIIELITEINAPVRICFDLARSIDLHKLSMKGSNEEAVAGVTTGLIGRGEEVTWRATHFGIRQKLTSRITGFDFPYYFRDEMTKGLFKKIEHDHIFEEKNGITIMQDRFEFESPLGLLGKFANILILKAYLKRLLIEKNKMIKEVAESDKWMQICQI